MVSRSSDSQAPGTLYHASQYRLISMSDPGDVGYEPEDVERNMGRHFKLAHRWGCVLLLDEADVFLAKRNVSISLMLPQFPTKL